MNAGQKVAARCEPPSSWADICEQCPDEWVCLGDVANTPDGAIVCGRLLGHDRSLRQVISRVGALPDTVIVHTRGRRLTFPRIEITDELRNVVRARR